MSLLSFTNSWLTAKPKIKGDDEKLWIKTSFKESVLYLFSRYRKVLVHRPSESVTIKTKSFWLFKRKRKLSFNDIRYIDYRFESIPTSLTFSLEGFTSADNIERFVVELVTNKKKYKVCTFKGEGARMTGWTGVFMGDSIVDFEGTQGFDSRQFANLLSEFIGKPLSTDDEMFEAINTQTCKHCGQEFSENLARCLYCGHLAE